jgi:hypothetical protein
MVRRVARTPNKKGEDVSARSIPKENKKRVGGSARDAESRGVHSAPECRRPSVVNQGGKMSRTVITISRTIFFRLLAHAPEELQREAKEDVWRAIPALCFTEDDIRERFAQEEQWDELSDDEQREAIQSLMDAGEYVT